ncbi:hypothetical protein B0J17DRAFT_52195 [Rhizoctonia solani]|nr:hypothetical protein B0J17DRAFT_52195 [Rhizoctonia solani]
MELSQHLFDLQMARYMRCAGESQPSPVPQVVAKPESPIRTVNQPSGTSDESTGVTNNAGTGASAATMQAPQFPSSVDVREVMERSNQLTERLATLLERSNELAERPTQSTEDIGSLAERFNQVLERLTQLVENTRQTTAPDPLTERFNQLFERLDRAVEYSDRSAQQANQLAERSNQLIERSNQLAEQLNQPSHLPNHLTARSNKILEQSNQLAERLNQVLGELHPVRRANELSERANQLSEHLYQSFQRSNQLAEQANGHAERLGNVMKNINKVLVGIQHAIIRNRKDNGWGAIFSLVNEAGEALGVSRTTEGISVGQAFKPTRSMDTTLIRVVLGASTIEYHVVTSLLGECLYFFGLSDGFCVDRTNTTLIQGRETDAGLRLADYLSSCFL